MITGNCLTGVLLQRLTENWDLTGERDEGQGTFVFLFIF